MGMLTDFFGSLFGIGYVGVKLAQEGIEKVERLEDPEMIKRFAEKYTDPELEKKLKEQLEDPSQHEAIWQRIEEYRRTHTRETVWFPVELYDAVYSMPNSYRIYKGETKGIGFSGIYGWDWIGKHRAPLTYDKNDSRARYQTVWLKSEVFNWLMFTYEKVPSNFTNKEYTMIGFSFKAEPEIRKYLRRNRRKYGI